MNQSLITPSMMQRYTHIDISIQNNQYSTSYLCYIRSYLVNQTNQIKLDAEDIASRLKAALDHSELMSKLREGARNTAVAYSWDRIGLEYIDMLKEIDAGKRSAGCPAVPLQA